VGLWMNQTGGSLTDAVDGLLNGEGEVHRRERLGVLNNYYRKAA
jgi:hypothetical protein